MKIDEYIAKVEEKINKKGSIISSWYSFSKGAKVGDVKADLLVRGNMYVKGFVISRMFSWMTPRWETLTVVFSHRGQEKASTQQLTKLIASTERYMSANDIKWSWLVYVSETGFEDKVGEFVKARLKREIGIWLVDLPSKDFTYNNVLVNKYGKRVFKP